MVERKRVFDYAMDIVMLASVVRLMPLSYLFPAPWDR